MKGYPTQPTIDYASDTESEATVDRPYGIRPVTYESFANNILAYDMKRPAGAAFYHKPRGSWTNNRIWAIAPDGSTRAPTVYDTDVNVKYEVTEPDLLSPFIFGSGRGIQASRGYKL